MHLQVAQMHSGMLGAMEAVCAARTAQMHQAFLGAHTGWFACVQSEVC